MKRSKTTSVLALSLAAFMACKKPAATQDKASPATATPAVAATAPATATTTAAATVASTTPIYISPGVPANALAFGRARQVTKKGRAGPLRAKLKAKAAAAKRSKRK